MVVARWSERDWGSLAESTKQLHTTQSYQNFHSFFFRLVSPSCPSSPLPHRKNHRSQPPFQLGFRALRRPERVVVTIGDRVPTRHRNRSQALLIYEKSPVDRRRRPSVRIDHVFLRRRWKTLEPSVARCRTLPTLFYLAISLVAVPFAGPEVYPSLTNAPVGFQVTTRHERKRLLGDRCAVVGPLNRTSGTGPANAPGCALLPSGAQTRANQPD